MPISPSKSPARGRVAGYSLLETLVALGIMSLGVAVIMPRAAAALDQVVVHTVQFDFQRQISALRRQAVQTNTALVVNDAAAQPAGRPAQIVLRAGWGYRLSAPLVIDTDAQCSVIQADLINHNQGAVHLEGRSDCLFIRTGIQRPR